MGNKMKGTPLHPLFIKGLRAVCASALCHSLAFAQQVPDNAIRNADGSRTILKSQQYPEANERHARWCKERGGVDITNEGNLTLESNTTDAVVCMRTDGSAGSTGAFVPRGNAKGAILPDAGVEKAPSLIPDTPPAWTPQQLRDQRKAPGSSRISPVPLASIPTVSVFPNHGYSITVGQLFYAASYAIFRDFSPTTFATVSSRIPALGCGWRWEGLIQHSFRQIDGYVACVANAPGTIGTTMDACAGWGCLHGEGTFVALPK